MSKQWQHAAPEIEAVVSQSIVRKIVLIFVVGLILGPLFAEGAAICYSQWSELMGESTAVRTPIIDSINLGMEDARCWLKTELWPPFNQMAKDPNIALPVACIFILLAMAMLRR